MRATLSQRKPFKYGMAQTFSLEAFNLSIVQLLRMTMGVTANKMEQKVCFFVTKAFFFWVLLNQY